MDEMSQEATASFRPCLKTADKEEIARRYSATAQALMDNDDKFKKHVESSFIYQYGLTPTARGETSQEVTENFRPRLTTAEKDEIAREVSAISNRAAARIMADDDDKFQKYVEASAKPHRRPRRIDGRLHTYNGNQPNDQAFQVNVAKIQRSSNSSHRSN
jgi:hypothetical protein